MRIPILFVWSWTPAGQPLWRRGELVLQDATRHLYAVTLIDKGTALWASMQPPAKAGGLGYFETRAAVGGPYELCLVAGSDLLFQPRNDGEDTVVPYRRTAGEVLA